MIAAAVAALFAGAAPATLAQDKGHLNIYCSMQIEWCTLAANEFAKATGVKVNTSFKGSGETFAQVKAEASNPKGDVWFGGTGDPHLQAAEEGLSEVYQSPNMKDLHNWAQYQAQISGYKTVGIYAGALGFSYNTEVLSKKKLPPPACWADIIKPEYKGDVQMANPAASGTAYTALATLVQVFGEDKAFDYLKALHKNISNYPKSGTGPVKAAARGETAIGVSFMHDVPGEQKNGFPVAMAAPCEGTGYEVGSMSILKGARNMENAKKFYDWALTPEAQKLAAQAKQYQLPSNKAAPQPPEAPRFASIKLIQYDFKKYGSSAERKRLLEKWEKEVNSIPR
ncbi:MAG: ABC transporter substrate-binding protein [Burkholderiales bacterium]|nr:ABC transporter substrate-binding protein [Burkholderiales bacterium]